MRLRAGAAGDLAGVVALERSVDRAPHWPEKSYAEALDGDARCLFVVEEDAVLLGFAVGALAGDEAELETVAVRLEARGKGLGRMLVEAVLAWAWQAGADSVGLEVRAGSAEARRLYARAGFLEEGRRPGYYSDPKEDALILRRAGMQAGAGRSEGEV